MKTICLVRHASSEKKNGKNDYTRTLNKRGEQDAKTLVLNIKKEPDHNFTKIITSPAIRAFETALIFADNLGLSEDKIEFKESLYNLNSQHLLLEAINSIDDSYENVLIIGHNPSIENTAKFLVEGFDHNMYTSSAMSIGFDIESWKKITKNSGKFLFYKFNRFNPNLSSLDTMIALSMKNEIYSKIESSLKDIESDLLSADIDDGEYQSEKIADKVFQKTEIITIRSLSVLDAEIARYEQNKIEKVKSKIQELDTILNDFNIKIQAKQSNKIAKIEKKKNKLLGKSAEPKSVSPDQHSE
jgi:phosphohistidine phosphatase